MAVLQGRNGLIKIKLPASSGAAPAPLVTGTGNPAKTYADEINTDGGLESADLLGNIRSWSLEESVETVDATVMSTSTGFIFRDLLPSFKAWTATADVLLDPAAASGTIDVGTEQLFRSGETVNIAIYPAGDAAATTDPVYYGKALITSKSQSASYDGLIEVSLTLEGRGTLFVAETA